MECPHPFVRCANATDHTKPFLSDIGYSIRIIFIVIILLLIISSNSVIWIVLRNSKHISKNTKYIMTSLCLTDLMLGVHLLTTLVSAIFDRWIFGNILCIYVSTCYQILFMITLYSYLLFLIDRYISIKFPLKHHQLLSKKRTIIGLTTIWIGTIVCVSGVTWIMDGMTTYYYSTIYTCFPLHNSSNNAISSMLGMGI